MPTGAIKDSVQKFPRMEFPQGMALPSEYLRSLELRVGNECLVGIKIAEDLSKPSDFAFFHGAARGNYSRVMGFAKPVVAQGSSIVAFDHSGHGESTGTEKQSSLAKRVFEAQSVINSFAGGNPRTVSGSSMGGYVAVKLLESYDIKNLILYCPGMYDRAAYRVRFDSGFSEIIRRQDSWKDTDAGELLEKFKGNLLVIIGSEDAVIPKGVISLIDDHAKNTRRKEILVVPGAPHAVHVWLSTHPEEGMTVAKKVADFSKG